jgi:hypothetical protein
MLLLIIGAAITLTAAAIIPGVRRARAEKAVKMGWVSQEWLAEHRSSHSG